MTRYWWQSPYGWLVCILSVVIFIILLQIPGITDLGFEGIMFITFGILFLGVGFYYYVNTRLIGERDIPNSQKHPSVQDRGTLLEKAAFYLDQHQYDAALEIYNIILHQREDVQNVMGQVQIMEKIGFIYNHLMNYPAALNMYQRALTRLNAQGLGNEPDALRITSLIMEWNNLIANPPFETQPIILKFENLESQLEAQKFMENMQNRVNRALVYVREKNNHEALDMLEDQLRLLKINGLEKESATQQIIDLINEVKKKNMHEK